MGKQNRPKVSVGQGVKILSCLSLNENHIGLCGIVEHIYSDGDISVERKGGSCVATAWELLSDGKSVSKSNKQRVHHDDARRQAALKVWREYQPFDIAKSDVARLFKININTFNMWTHELEPVVIGEREKLVDFNQEPTVTTLLEQILFETKGVRDELKSLMGGTSNGRNTR